MPPALKALLAQLAGFAAAIALARSGGLGGLWALVGAQAVVAATVAAGLRSARWWLPIHLGFTEAQTEERVGLVARRILCDIKDGDTVMTGQRYGLIRFGSRVDVYLPPGVAPLVAVGQYAIGGETVFADLASGEPAREGEVR